MYKQIFILTWFLVVAKSQVNNLRNDDYLNLIRRQYAENIKKYDLEMATFKQNYAGRATTIEIQLEMLLDGLVQNEEYLNPLEVLSDFSKECVTKYRPLVPTIDSTKSTINACITTSNNQVNGLLNAALSTRNTLQSYYNVNFERDITNCNKTYVNSTLNYTMCATGVVSTTNTYTISNQKTFAIQMESAQCSERAHLKKALDCSFSAQNRTISRTAEANTLINKCLQGLDDCNLCKQGYRCPNVEYISQNQVDYRNLTMTNPFLGRNQTSECLMLQIY